MDFSVDFRTSLEISPSSRLARTLFLFFPMVQMQPSSQTPAVLCWTEEIAVQISRLGQQFQPNCKRTKKKCKRSFEFSPPRAEKLASLRSSQKGKPATSIEEDSPGEFTCANSVEKCGQTQSTGSKKNFENNHQFAFKSSQMLIDRVSIFFID